MIPVHLEIVLRPVEPVPLDPADGDAGGECPTAVLVRWSDRPGSEVRLGELRSWGVARVVQTALVEVMDVDEVALAVVQRLVGPRSVGRGVVLEERVEGRS